MWWPKSALQAELVALAGDLAERFSARAEGHDRAGSFPYENFRDLHESGYLALTIPPEFGGRGVSVIDAVLAQERLARGDGSTGLGASMHLSILGRIGRAVLAGDTAEAGGWDRERYGRVARAVIEEGALINSVASEPETGSPSRGGRPSTRAVPDGDGWFRLSGRKTYTTMAPALRFFMVSATIATESGEEAGQFLLEAGTPGMRIEETWDTVGMRASGSHDLVLEDVRVPASAVLTRRRYAPAEPSAVAPPAASASKPPAEGAGWAALIPAVYLGVATAARDAAVRFARERRPQPMGGKAIADLPSIQRSLGEMEVALSECRALLFGVAEAWVEAPDRRAELVPLLAAAKYVVTNRGLEVADRAMRVVGGAGLSRSHPVQRYYRDLRAGLHNPPMDDVALTILARAALERAG